METIGTKTEDSLLNQRDLVLAAYSLAQLHNAYLQSLENGDYKNDMTEEQMHSSIQSIHSAHVKFSALIESMQSENTQQETEEEDGE